MALTFSGSARTHAYAADKAVENFNLLRCKDAPVNVGIELVCSHDLKHLTEVFHMHLNSRLAITGTAMDEYVVKVRLRERAQRTKQLGDQSVERRGCIF